MSSINENIIPDIPKLSLSVKKLNIDSNNHDLRGTHFHKEFEIFKVDEGSFIFCSEGIERIVSAGDIVFINSFCIHEFKVLSKRCSATYFQIDLQPYINIMLRHNNDYLYRFIHKNYANRFEVVSFKDDVSRVIDGIIFELDSKESYYELQIKAYIFQLIVHLFKCKFILDSDLHLESKLIEKVFPAIEIINKNYYKKIFLDDVCEELHIDKYYFCKLFKKVTGSTFVVYLNFVRLNKAEELLLSSDHSISEIALECGFSSTQYFNKLFNQYHGFSPSHYKKIYF